MKRRLSGWQRIGVVVSIIWLIGSLIYTVNTQYNNKFVLYSTIYDLCKMEKNADYKRCNEGFEANLKKYLKADWTDLADLFFISIVPIPVGWLVSWGVIRVYRWIRAGFSN